MSDIDKQANDYLLINEEHITHYAAPDLSEEIWQRHQSKKRPNYRLIAACTCLISMIFFFQSSFYSPKPDSFIAQNYQLEMQLAKVSIQVLSEEQQQVMTNWRYELELLDQDLELLHSNQLSRDLWSNRIEILTKMIDFYSQPIELYEI